MHTIFKFMLWAIISFVVLIFIKPIIINDIIFCFIVAVTIGILGAKDDGR